MIKYILFQFNTLIHAENSNKDLTLTGSGTSISHTPTDLDIRATSVQICRTQSYLKFFAQLGSNNSILTSAHRAKSSEQEAWQSLQQCILLCQTSKWHFKLCKTAVCSRFSPILSALITVLTLLVILWQTVFIHHRYWNVNLSVCLIFQSIGSNKVEKVKIEDVEWIVETEGRTEL